MQVIIDTNIFLEYLSGKQPYCNYAKKFFKETISCKYTILILPIVLIELKNQNAYSDLELTLFKTLKKRNKIIFTEKQIKLAKEAKKISIEKGIPFTDCLISLEAKQKKVIILTRDKHFYLDLIEFADSFKPEELT